MLSSIELFIIGFINRRGKRGIEMYISRITLFKISYILILIKSLVYNSYIAPDNNMALMTLFNYIALAFLVIEFLWKIPKEIKFIIVTLGLFATFLYIYKPTKSTDLILWVLFIVNSVGLNKAIILKWAYRILIIGTTIIIVLNLFGFIEQYVLVKDGVVVKSYGFIHPNGLATTILRIILLYFGLYYKKVTIPKLLFIAIAYIIIGRLTGCRTASFVLIMSIGLIVYSLINKEAFESRITLLLMTISPFIAAIFSFTGGYLFIQGNPGMQIINQLFSDRFNWIGRFLQNYSITLFGQELQVINRVQGGARWSSIDNSYVMMGLNYGMIFLFGYCLVIALLIFYYIKHNDKGKAISCFAFVLIGLTENQAFSIVNNFMLLYAGDVIYGKVFHNMSKNNSSTFEENSSAIGES